MGESRDSVSQALRNVRRECTDTAGAMYLLARNYMLALSIFGGALLIALMHREQLASAIFLTAYCAAVTIFWLLRGRVTLDRYNAMLEQRYRRILTETDYLYLFMEHEPAEILRRHSPDYRRLWNSHNQPGTTFSDRVELLARNMDRLSRRLRTRSSAREPWLNTITLFAVVLPVVAVAVALLLGHHWLPVERDFSWTPIPLLFVLLFCSAQRLLFGNIAISILSDARWRVLVDELLAGRD